MLESISGKYACLMIGVQHSTSGKPIEAQSDEDSKDINSSYSIRPEPSSSMSSINFSMSIVISNSCLMISISLYASIDPSLSAYPPRATNASNVSSSFEAP